MSERDSSRVELFRRPVGRRVLRHAAYVPYVEFFLTDDARFTESIKLAQSVDAERTNCRVITAADFAMFLKSP